VSDDGPGPHAGCVLGIDVGTVRVGVAASDPTQMVATPVATLARGGRHRDLWSRLSHEMEQRDAHTVVVGLPRQLDGSEGDAAANTRRFADELHQRTGAQVEFWDERFTTAQAERSLIAAGMRRQQRRAAVDSVAAALLLQSWLDARRSGSVARPGG
jgi:putative Holliday junction resolvase